MEPKFEKWDYVRIIMWAFASMLWLITAILSIISQDGFITIFLRFFIVFLNLLIMLNYWFSSKERVEQKAYENELEEYNQKLFKRTIILYKNLDAERRVNKRLTERLLKLSEKLNQNGGDGK